MSTPTAIPAAALSISTDALAAQIAAFRARAATCAAAGQTVNARHYTERADQFERELAAQTSGTALPTVEIIECPQLRGRGRFASAAYVVRCENPALSRACRSRNVARHYLAELVQSGKAVAA